MTANHAHFEVLCALAASGQLTRSELAELHGHVEGCASCSDRLAEMAQVSADLFCAHLAHQPRTRMPVHMLERFVARANSEGVPLNPRTESAHFSRPVLAAAFLLVLLLAFTAMHFRSFTSSPDETPRGNTGGVSASNSASREPSLSALESVKPAETQASRTARSQKASGNGRRIESASRAVSSSRESRVDSAGLEQSQFDFSVYSRSIAMFHRPFFATAKPDQNTQWIPARYGAPRFNFVHSSEFASDDQSRLLAEYDYQPFVPSSAQDRLAFGPADEQVLRRDFDPISYSAVLKLDFKRNLPAFQFTPNALQ